MKVFPTRTTRYWLSASSKAVKTAQRDATVVVQGSRNAPADENFGQYRMTPVGIPWRIKCLAHQVDTDPKNGESVFTFADWVENSIQDWQARYPQDQALPRVIFALQVLYQKVNTNAGRSRAARVGTWLKRDYPSSNFAGLSQRTLVQRASLPQPCSMHVDWYASPAPPTRRME